MYPLDLEDFAYGFSLTERIIDHHDQITNVVVNDKRKDGYEIFIDIQSDKYLKLKKEIQLPHQVAELVDLPH